jgi:hypothetical protein
MEQTFNWDSFDNLVAPYVGVEDLISKTFDYGPEAWVNYGVYFGYDLMIESLTSNDDEEEEEEEVE